MMTRNFVGLAMACALIASLGLSQNCALGQQSSTADGQSSADQATQNDANATDGNLQTSTDSQNADNSAPNNSSDPSQSADVNSTQQTSGQPIQTPGSRNDVGTQSPSANQSRVQNQSQDTQSQGDGQPGNRSNPNWNSQSQPTSAQTRVGGNQDWRRGVQFGRSNDRGLTVTSVERNNFFFNSGIRQNDVILSVDGRQIRSDADFYSWVAVRRGARIPVLILRDGREETIYIQSPEAFGQPQQEYATQQFQSGDRPFLGVAFDPQTRDAAIIASVVPGGPADQAGLQSGDTVVALNGEPVRSHRDAIAVIGSMRPGDRLAVVYERFMENQADVVLGGQPSSSSRNAYRSVPDGDSVMVAPGQYQSGNYQGNSNRETDVVVGEDGDLDRREFDDNDGPLDRDRNDNDRPNEPLRRRLLGR
jgi:membrane-associated protease RseP (regulator of RpoE activity)